MLAVVVLVLAALSWSLPVRQEVRQVAAATVVGAFMVSEILGGVGHRRMSLRWLVPTTLVNGNDATAAIRWGRSLGFGFLTDAPYAVFHVALVVPVIFGQVGVSLVVVIAFVVARAVPYLIAPIGRNASSIGDFTISGRAVLFDGARIVSAAALAATFVWMVL
ncbi:hypothetical protein FHR32_007721 [Streptosporangium album]|uniref:Uncharacterized protein n=1 Tax=Streptosporangium album TaxID=47479 RepID=A0A7W7WDN6_9ACTN|nr:hypothetical protein [Streptosporangium album]MBB4943321.1 hypothetical protein [Streptosporangium album]